jgi:hypothetical protein
MEKLMILSASIFLTLPLLSLAGHDEIEDIYSKYGGPRLYRYYHPLSSDRHQVEDVFNRFGGPPLYRYYDRLPSHHSYPHYYNSYSSYYGRYPYRYDANYYWGDKYYGNENPNPYDEYWLDREIMNLENHVR